MIDLLFYTHLRLENNKGKIENMLLTFFVIKYRAVDINIL